MKTALLLVGLPVLLASVIALITIKAGLKTDSDYDGATKGNMTRLTLLYVALALGCGAGFIIYLT